MRKLFYLAFAVVFLATACTEEQSSYSIESITDAAIITGTVQYNQGYKETSSGVYVNGYLAPAENQTVLVRVGYDQYSATSTGEKVYETTTDENGKYSIEIPVVNSINVTVEVVAFTGSYSTLLNQSIVVLEEALYNQNNTYSGVTLSSKSVKTADITLTTSSEFTSNELTLPVYVAGNIISTCELATNSSTSTDISYAEYTFSAEGTMPIKKQNAYLKFTNAADNTTIIYEVTSNSDGEISKDEYMLLADWDYTKVTVSMDIDKFYVTNESDNAFTHYYALTEEKITDTKYRGSYPQSLNGTYEYLDTDEEKLDPLYSDGSVYPSVTLTLCFKPISGTQVKGVNSGVTSTDSTSPLYATIDPYGLGDSL